MVDLRVRGGSCMERCTMRLWLLASSPAIEPEVSLASRKSLCLGVIIIAKGSTMHEDISNPWQALRNPRIWNDLAIQRRLKDEFPHFSKITDKWGFIRQVYMEHLPIIVEVSKKKVRAKIDPYFVDWLIEFTPIESDAWTSIRGKGVPLYPQFPLF